MTTATVPRNFNGNNGSFQLKVFLPFESLDDAEKKVQEWPRDIVLRRLDEALDKHGSLPGVKVPRQSALLVLATSRRLPDLSEELLSRIVATRWDRVWYEVLRRADLPESILIQMGMLSLEHFSIIDSWDEHLSPLRQTDLPMWMLNVALNLRYYHQAGSIAHKVALQVLQNPHLPLEARARLTNPARVTSRHSPYRWVKKNGQLKKNLLRKLETSYPDLVDMPAHLIVSILAELPVTDPEWSAVPAAWAEKVAEIADLPTEVAFTADPNWFL